MDLYNHFIFAGLSLAITLGLTNWQKLGRALAVPLFAIDLAVHIFVQFNIVFIVIATVALMSIIREIATKKALALPRKTKLLGGFIFTTIGAIGLFISPYPYFLVAGLVITLFAYLDKK